MPIDTIHGGGPWLLEISGDLSPGQFDEFPLRGMEYNKQKGFFQPWMPLDESQVTNLDQSNPLKVTYNGKFESYILPNSVETFDDMGITKIRIENIGDTAIPANNIKLEVSKSAYDGNDAARERKETPPVFRIIKSVTGTQL